MYTIVGPVPSRAFRVLWMPEEPGLDFDRVKAVPHGAEAHKFNPAGKVPVLADGVALTDSVAIMRFPADRHGAFFG